jgi:hypothetical protein
MHGQCKRAFRSAGAYPNITSCEETCKAPPLRYDCDVRNYQCKESGSNGTFPSTDACTGACGIRCPSWSQLFDGYCYAVMDQHNKTNHGNDTGGLGNQTNWTALPPGWEVAPYVYGLGPALYSQVLYKYAWGTDYLVYSTPCSNATLPGDANMFSCTWSACEGYCGFRLVTSVSANGTYFYKTANRHNASVWHSKAVMRIPAIG